MPAVNAITIQVIGNGHFEGAATNLTDYTVREDATPIVGGDSRGGTGDISFGVSEDPAAEGSFLLLSDTVRLSDGSNGKTEGVVNGLTVSAGGQADVTADGLLNRLMVVKQTSAYTGTLEDYLRYLLGLGGIGSGLIIIDSSATSTVATAVNMQAFNDRIWNKLKECLIVRGLEIAYVSGFVTIRAIRKFTADTTHNEREDYSLSNVDLAQSVEVVYYLNTYRTDYLVYPKGGWNEDVDVIQVDAGQTVTQEYELDVSLVSVDQPSVVNSVTKGYTGPTSVYCVAGNDGLPITAAQWSATGGKLSLSIGKDKKTLIVKVTGAAGATSKYAPYRIAMASGPSDYYSSLRVVGTGVHYTPTTLTVPTGVPASKTDNEVGATIDNPYVSSLQQAYTIGMRAAQRFTGASLDVRVSASVVNRAGRKGDITPAKFSLFDTTYAGQTFATWDATWAGQTFAQFNTAMYALTQNDFDNQAFGNVAGARVQLRHAWYRIDSATIAADGISYAASRDTTFSDHNTVWSGKTFAQWDTRFAGKTFGDYGVIPLWQ